MEKAREEEREKARDKERETAREEEELEKNGGEGRR